MENLAKPLAVVTGASSGIGYGLSRQFAENGFDLIIAAENGSIEEAADFLRGMGAQVQIVQVDLKNYEGVEQLYAVMQSGDQAVDAIAIKQER